MPFLGSLEDYPRASRDEIVLAAKSERIDLQHNEISQIPAKCSLFSGIAASLRGKLLHTTATKLDTLAEQHFQLSATQPTAL